VLQHRRGDKVIAFKKRRRKNSRRKRGYRHEFSVIRITEILTGGAKPSQTPPARPQREGKKPKATPEAGIDAAGAEAGEVRPKKAAAKKPAAKKPAKTANKPKATKGKKK
jgi:large subunit ribosomal protein L21